MSAAFESLSFKKASPKKRIVDQTLYQEACLNDWIKGTPQKKLSFDEEVEKRVVQFKAEIEEQKKQLLQKEQELNQMTSAFFQQIEKQKQHRQFIKEESLKLVFWSLEKILDCELKTNPQILQNFIQRLLDYAHPDQASDLILHPNDKDLLLKANPDFEKQLKTDYQISIVVDENQIKAGQIKLEMPEVTTLVDLKAQVEKVWQEMFFNDQESNSDSLDIQENQETSAVEDQQPNQTNPTETDQLPDSSENQNSNEASDKEES